MGTKQDISEEMLLLLFLDHSQNHADSIKIFTDGSKSDAGVGFGVSFPDFNRNGRLPEQSSIFTAECYAVLVALKEIASRPKENYIICCDSKSVLQAIGHFNTFHPVVLEMMEWLHLLKSRAIQVSFCWSPAHIGIAGNEKADSLAKAAINNNTIIRCPLPASDVFPMIHSVISDAWNFSWQLENQKMREIARSIQPWKYSSLK